MKRINLLPGEDRAKAKRERGLIYAVLVLVAVVIALGLVYVAQNSSASSKQEELDGINAQVAVLQQQVAELQPYADIQTQRTAMTDAAKGIYQAGVPWSSILQQVSLVIPDNVRLTGLNCTVPATMLPGTVVAAAPAPATEADVTFTGQTYEHRDVAEFMTRLGLIPQLTDIKLTSSTEATATEGTAVTVTFTVTARLRPYLAPPPTTTLQTEAGQ
jgi:Tfp pilus assembly protein PilN